MAFIPDDAMLRKREISGSAWDAYTALCKFGDPDTGIVEDFYLHQQRPFERYANLVRYSGRKLGTVRNALTELRREGWIMEHNGHIFLRVGTFLDACRKKPKKSARPSPVSEEISPYSEESSPTSDGAYIDRARDSYQPDQTNQPSMSVADVESSAREPGQQQQLILNDESLMIVDEEFLDRLQAARKYRERGVDVRAVLEVLCIKTGLAREQVTRRHLMGWCDRERPVQTADDGGGDNGTTWQRTQPVGVSAADRRDGTLRSRDYDQSSRDAVAEMERDGRGF